MELMEELPLKELGNVELETLAAITFSAYFRPQNASGSRKKYDSLAQSIRKN